MNTNVRLHLTRRVIVAFTSLSALTLLAASLVPALAGAVGGPKSSVETVDAESYDTYRIQFRGGVQARVAAVAGTGNDIDMYIYDAGGHLITKDSLPDSTPVCVWTPRWTGTFTVKITNNEDSDVRYALRTN